MKRLSLTQEKTTIVDKSDFDFLNQHKWYFSHGYAMRDENGKRIYLHRYLLRPKIGFEVDHINRDKLDNRRSNLRIVTRQENSLNRGIPINNTTGYKGVIWYKRDKIWVAQIKINYKNIFLGRYKNLSEAIIARQKAEIKYKII